MSTISVIIPAFNAAATIEETLASVTAQRYAAEEIIVVDDGSSDETAQIASRFSSVHVLRQQNAGVAAALNAGMAVAHGNLIACLDADDLWLPECLASHERHLQSRPDIDASVGWFTEFICPTLTPETARRFRPRPPQPGWFGGATLFRRTMLEKTGTFDPQLRLGAWIDWVDRARLAGSVFAVMDTIVLQRRLHPGSLSMTRPAQDKSFLELARKALVRRRLSS